MEFTDKIIRSNFKEFNNLTTQEFWELLKINPFLISHIPYPTNNQIEYVLAFDTERHNILSSIQNIPVDTKIYKYKEELQKKTKDNDDNDSYCVIPEDRLNRINKTLTYDNHLVNTLGLTKQEIFTMYRDNRGIYDDYINEVKFLQLLQYLDINKVPSSMFEEWIEYVNYFIDYNSLPQEYKNKDSINELLDITTKLKLDTMPKDMWDNEIIIKYVGIISTNILDVPIELLSEELLAELIEKDNSILEELPLPVSTKLSDELATIIDMNYIKYLDNISDKCLVDLCMGESSDFLENLSIQQLQRLINLEDKSWIDELYPTFNSTLTSDLKIKSNLINNTSIIDYIIKYSQNNLSNSDTCEIINAFKGL